MRGGITKMWQACCARCERTLAVSDFEPQTNLRQIQGWGTRRGLWVCNTCLPHVPRGADPLAAPAPPPAPDPGPVVEPRQPPPGDHPRPKGYRKAWRGQGGAP